MIVKHIVWVTEPVIPRPRAPQQSRRSHRKSRGGCKTCKGRRVKCDEASPVCKQCLRRGTSCEYSLPKTRQPCTEERKSVPPMVAEQVAETSPWSPTSRRRKWSQHQRVPNSNTAPTSDITTDPPAPRHTWPTTSALSQESALGIHAVGTHIASMVSLSTRSARSINTLPYLISHFISHSSTTLSSYTGQIILRNKIPEMILEHKFLLHTVLAFAASHLEYLEKAPATNNRMVMTAAWHSSKALKLYGDKISWYQSVQTIPPQKEEAEMWLKILAEDEMGAAVENETKDLDALVAACIMLTSLFFRCRASEGDGAHNSWTQNILRHPALRSVMKSRGVVTEMWTTNVHGFAATDLSRFHLHDRTHDTSCYDLSTHRGDKKGSWMPAGIQAPPSTFSQLEQLSDAMPDLKPQMNWLTTVTGMSILLSLPSFKQNFGQSIWLPFFREANEQHNGFHDDLLPNAFPPGHSSAAGQTTRGNARDKGPLTSSIHPSTTKGDTHNRKSRRRPTGSKSHNLIGCSDVVDPAFQLSDLPQDQLPPEHRTRDEPNFQRLEYLLSILADHPCARLRKQYAMLSSIVPHLRYLLSLDSRNMNNFSPIISFPSRLPPEYPSLFIDDEEESDSRQDHSSSAPGFSQYSADTFSCFLAAQVESGLWATDDSFPGDTRAYPHFDEELGAPAGDSWNPLEDGSAWAAWSGSAQDRFNDLSYQVPDQASGSGTGTFAHIPNDAMANSEPFGADVPSTTNFRLQDAILPSITHHPSLHYLQYTFENRAVPVTTSDHSDFAASTSSAISNSSTPLTTSTSACTSSTCASCAAEQSVRRMTLPLLIMGYWFGKLADVPHWWCADRGRLEGDVVEGVLLPSATYMCCQPEQKWHDDRVNDMQDFVQSSETSKRARIRAQTHSAMREAILEFVAWRKHSRP